MKAYQIQGQRNGVQLPTFYLDANVQGIIGNVHASRIAADVLGDGLREYDLEITVMGPSGQITEHHYTQSGFEVKR